MLKDEDDNLIFQVLDWDFFHEDDDDGKKQFSIRLFGKNKNQQSVYLQVDDFKPYFFVELEDHWKYTTVDAIVTEVKKKVPKDKVDGLIRFNIQEKYKFWGFTNYKKFKFAKLTFNDFESMKSYSYAFSNKKINVPTVSRKWLKFKLYESNILPVLRFMHIRQLEAFGWVSIKKSDLEDFSNSPTCNEINYKTKWQSVNKVDDRLIEKFSIASFDIECTSGDGSFPQPNRPEDKVIQIGITTSRYGEPECYSQHLLSLNKTSDISGATVEWFSSEEDLLLGFTKYIRKLNPDIITGYNIFGFDFKYLYERSKFLGIELKFSRLSRVNGENSEWIEQNLSSAALGTNILTYYKMTGRVIIDLMKVIQRDHKLSSYKLDSVASYFIREKITKFNVDSKTKTTRIDTKNTFGLYVGRYIVIVYAEGPVESTYKDGEKFKIIELGKDYITIDGLIDTNELIGKGYELFWCQAKDDIKPSQIFSKFKGSPDDRAEVGMYCLQDCNLCNKLIDKLQIITNNVGMANVCNVPLSYLFLRGQGVKIFSLVAKKCREKDHLIPVIKKKTKPEDIEKRKQQNADPNKPIDPLKAFKEKQDMIMDKFISSLNNKHRDEEVTEDDDVGYEGAIVFPPRAGVYFEPITVLDYASLYPSSMILRNLSHEMFVDDPQYDNLPGYRYHIISYRVMTKEDLEEKAKENIRAKSKSKKKSNNMIQKQFDQISTNDMLEGVNQIDGADCGSQMVTCRFAEKLDGSKGIIPEILQDLLTARKKFKKMQEQEKDPFTKGIYESLQLAYKVTANSLYGQTGASTSPVCMKEIAASTTATGREMLQFSKYFIEFIYAKVINLALDNEKKYYSEMKKIFNCYPTTVEYPDTNRETNEVTNVKLHVATDIDKELPETKFIRQLIGYEVDMEFDKEFTDFFNEIKKKHISIYNCIFTDVLEKGKPTGMITFGSLNKDDQKHNNILIQMFNLSVEKRDELFNDIKKYVIKNKGTTKSLFNNYKEFWQNLLISDDSILKKALLKPLQELNEDVKAVFMSNLEILVDEIGYNGKNEMFLKFYKFINKTIKGYHVVSQEVIYGDSVVGNTPLILKDEETEEIIIKRIDEITNDWTKYKEFKTNDTNDYFMYIVKLLTGKITRNDNSKNETYSYWYDAWIDLSKVKLNFKKKLFFTKTECWYEIYFENNKITIDTDLIHDCDLIDKYTFKKINNKFYLDDDKISNIVIGELKRNLPKKIQSLFNGWTIKFLNNDNTDFRSDNLILVNDKIDLDDFYNKINNILKQDHFDRSDKEQSFTNYKIWDGDNWVDIKRIIRHKTNKNIYRVSTKTSVIDVTEDHSLICSNGKYIKPEDCKVGNNLMQSYPKNMKITNNKKYDVPFFDSDDKIECSKYILQSKLNNYNVIFMNDREKHLMYRTKNQAENSEMIMEIHKLGKCNDYVYDLETSSGHFHAGIGELIIKNTDSVFYCSHFTDDKTNIKLKDKKSLLMAIFTGIWASILIGTLLPAPMAQEFEKVMWPLVLQGKKRYVGNLYEKDVNKYKQKVMGLELRRRDNAPIVKIVLSGLVHEILNNRSAEGAYNFTREMLHKIITGKFKLDKFIITKTLKGNALTKPERKIEALKPKENRSYANRSQIVHAVLADRMADRDPGNRPLSNDRIPYIYIEPKGTVKLQGDRVETPDYIIENKLKIDYLFYITNQIKVPALKFLDLMIENADKLFIEFEIKEKNRKDCVMPINFYFEKNEKINEDEIEKYEQDYYENYSHDSGSDDETNINNKRKNKKIVQDLVYFENLMTSKHDSDTLSDNEKPKKKKKNITKNTKEPSKQLKKNLPSGELTYGDLLNDMDVLNNSDEELPKKNKKISNKKNILNKKKTELQQVTTSGELFDDLI